jgi:hypothetical protein
MLPTRLRPLTPETSRANATSDHKFIITLNPNNNTHDMRILHTPLSKIKTKAISTNQAFGNLLISILFGEVEKELEGEGRGEPLQHV